MSCNIRQNLSTCKVKIFILVGACAIAILQGLAQVSLDRYGVTLLIANHAILISINDYVCPLDLSTRQASVLTSRCLFT